MFIEGFRHCKVLIDIISHDLFSIPVVEWVVTAAAPILQMQRLSLREVRAPKITDSECGVLTSCVPFSCNCHIHWPHSLCTQLFGRLPGPSFNLSDLQKRPRHSPLTKRVPSTLAISAFAIIPKFKNNTCLLYTLISSLLMLFTAFSGQSRFSFKGLVTGKAHLGSEISFL